jgi:hypothetical protein
LFLSEHFRIVWLDQANGVLALMAKTRVDPSLERCQAILFLKSKWQPNTVADWLSIHPDYSLPATVSASPNVQSGVEKLEEKDMDKLAEKVAAKVGEKDSVAVEKLKTELGETKTKLTEAEGKVKTADGVRDETKNLLTVANKTIEDLRKQLPGGGLLSNPPVMMPVAEAVKLIKEVLPVPMVQRAWGLGPQRLCQDLQRVVQKLEAKK